MRIYRAGWWLLGVAGLSAFSGCVSPRENLYSLGLHTPVAASYPSLPILIGPVSVPQLVDRPQLVIRDGEFKVKILEQERWATPLKESLPGLLVDGLSQHVPGHRFVSASSRAVAGFAGRFAVDISRLDLAPGAGARMTAHWIYRPSDTAAKPQEGDADVTVKAVGAGIEPLVQALRSATSALADEIANHLTLEQPSRMLSDVEH